MALMHSKEVEKGNCLALHQRSYTRTEYEHSATVDSVCFNLEEIERPLIIIRIDDSSKSLAFI